MSDITKQKPEMTAEQLVEKWGWPYAEEGWKEEDCTEELRADLRSVIRGKLVEFKKWHNKECGWRGGTILESEIDNFLSNSPVSNGESGC